MIMNNDVAILLDLDNIVIGATEINLTFDVNIILRAVREMTQGRLVLRRAYGDWRQNKNMPKQLATAGFELQSAVRLNQSSKNLADMQLVVDAMETLIDGHNFSTYVIVTGDRDFLPLVQTLRKRGRRVIGVGIRHTVSSSLIDLCDEYIYYDDIAREQGEKPFRKIEDLLQRAVEELLTSQDDRSQASLLKERMQSLSQGAFGRSPEGRKNFRKFLEQYPEMVQLEQADSTLYVRRPRKDNGRRPTPPEPKKAPRKLRENEIVKLLRQAVEDLLREQPRVRASIFKQRLNELTDGAFDQTELGADSFRTFLERHGDILGVQQSGTTVYVTPPATEVVTGELHTTYLTELKKRGLRVVPHEKRLRVLKDMIGRLQQSATCSWKELVDNLSDAYGRQNVTVSKSKIHDVIRLAKRAEVIRQSGNGRSLATTQLELAIADEKLFQEAVIRCDAALLQELQTLSEPFDLEQAALALYDDVSYTRYLKVVSNRFSVNGLAN
jgi:uncharacterized LabA/DUF88 family protein